jgi:hypothetical protein
MCANVLHLSVGASKKTDCRLGPQQPAAVQRRWRGTAQCPYDKGSFQRNVPFVSRDALRHRHRGVVCLGVICTIFD